MNQKPKRGRPAKFTDGGLHKHVYVDRRTFLYLHALGDGNFSVGIRKAAKIAMDSTKIS